MEKEKVQTNVNLWKKSIKDLGMSSWYLVRYFLCENHTIILLCFLTASIIINICFYISKRQSIDRANHKIFILQQKLDSIQNVEEKTVNLNDSDLNKYFK